MKESTEELKTIIGIAPKDGLAEYVDVELDFFRMDEYGETLYYINSEWVECDAPYGLRSLSDIEEIIKLREFIAGLQLSVPDEVKANELLGVDDGC